MRLLLSSRTVSSLLRPIGRQYVFMGKMHAYLKGYA